MKKRKPKSTLNRSCSSCGDRPARPRDGKLACRMCVKLPAHLFQDSVTELTRISEPSF